MEYAFSCGFFDIFLYFQHCFGGKGGAEVVVFKKTNKKRKVQRKMLGVPSNFGSDCSNVTTDDSFFNMIFFFSLLHQKNTTCSFP